MNLFDKLLRRRHELPSHDLGVAAVASLLRRDVAALEADLADRHQHLANVRSSAKAFEERAMSAIRAGDDRAARDALAHQQTAAEEAALLAADIHGLQAMLAECSDVLRRSIQAPAATDRDLAPPAELPPCP